MKQSLSIICGVIIAWAICISSCKDNETCPSDITNDIEQNIHYNKLYSCNDNDPNGNYTRFYKSWEDYRNDSLCTRLPIPSDLGFKGIVLAQGVKLPFISENESTNPAYQLDVDLSLDKCAKHVDFEFILTHVDTFKRFEHNRNVIVLLNGIDSTYTVDFSHKIIPLGE